MVTPVARRRVAPLSAKILLERNGLFRGLPTATIERVAGLASRRTYKRDAAVFMRGDPGDALYGVATGRVRISASAPGGKEVFLNVMEPGDSFGEIALLDGQPRTATATTLATTELIIVQRQQFQALLQREPSLAVHLIELLCQRVRWTSEQFEDSSLLNAPARLAKRLLSLAGSQNGIKAAETPLRISQEETARFLGLSRQIVNKHLQTWKRRNWVRLGRGTVLVIDENALRKVTRAD